MPRSLAIGSSVSAGKSWIICKDRTGHRSIRFFNVTDFLKYVVVLYGTPSRILISLQVDRQNPQLSCPKSGAKKYSCFRHYAPHTKQVGTEYT